jgi:heat shock protein HtpX
MPNIYQNIGSNKRDTAVIMFLFVVVIGFLGWFVGNYFYDGSGYSFLGFALVFSGLSGIFSYYTSDSLVLAISGAKELSKEEAPDLHNLVENMCIASGIPMPKVYIMNDSSMNAFATGRDPKHSSICFTTGIVQRLEKRELEGVVAHEMSHIGNYDTRLMCIVSILVGSISLLSNWMTRGFFFRGRRRSSGSGGELGGILFLVGLVLLILSPLISTLIKLALSRQREYLADSTAALITRYPMGLANALRKISQDTEILEAANSATAHLYITDPVRGRIGSSASSLFDTHPPIEERIKRLEAM